mgnify:CR=1 FL=1
MCPHNSPVVNWTKRRPHWIPSLIAAIMLLAALGKWPYGYFILLRWVVTASAVFVAIVALNTKQYWGIWLFGLLAILFNPIAPVHLNRTTWQPIDVVTAGIFVAAVFLIRHLPKPKRVYVKGEEKSPER